MLTGVPAAEPAFSQFSDTYNPVPPPEAAYAIESWTSAVAPASAGAVPSTTTFPVHAAVVSDLRVVRSTW